MEASDIHDILKAIAVICDGYCSLTDSGGKQLCTFHPDGYEVTRLRGSVFSLAEKAATTGDVQIGLSQVMEGALMWAIPFGGYVITANNSIRVQREQSIADAIECALPQIARVVGGYASLFDREGKIINLVNHNGIPIQERIGQISSYAKETMERLAPTFTPSVFADNTVAFRIPVSYRFGLGFNNIISVDTKNGKSFPEENQSGRSGKYTLSDIIGKSGSVLAAKALCKNAANASSVLISGESGTGKELFAHAIHNIGPRKKQPFIAINCGAMPAGIIESYLFGYVGGAYTGAKREGSPGAFEQANKGTIFLDEISEMPLDIQVRLLRVLQEKEIMRVGDFKSVKLDIKIIVSSNRSLRDLVKEGKFREDLYYRINGMELKLPPLRQHIEDIPLLVNHYIREYNFQFDKYITGISEEALRILMYYDWPGNIRELQACIEQAVNLSGGAENELLPRHLPSYLTEEENAAFSDAGDFNLRKKVERLEALTIRQALQYTQEDKKAACRLLGLSPTTFWRKLQFYGIPTPVDGE